MNELRNIITVLDTTVFIVTPIPVETGVVDVVEKLTGPFVANALVGCDAPPPPVANEIPKTKTTRISPITNGIDFRVGSWLIFC